MKKLQRGLPKGRYSKYGYKRNSPDVNKPFNIIPSGNITMKDVDFPVKGIDNLGNEMLMVPGGEYFFPGDYVIETPLMQRGGPKFQQYTPAAESTGANYTPTYFAGTLPEVMVSSDDTSYPYYNKLTAEEKKYFNQNSPIGRAVRSIAFTGKRGKTANDLGKIARGVEEFAAEMTGIPGSIRFSQDPVKKLKGLGRTVEATILGSSPFITAPYNKEDVADTFDALDALGFATTTAGLAKMPLQKAANLTGRYLTQGPLRNAYNLLPEGSFSGYSKLRNADKSYRVAGMDAYDDFVESGVLRSNAPNPPAGASLEERAMLSRPTGFPSFQKGFADLRYLPDNGGVVFETSLPTFKRGEINPVTGQRIKGRHYAHRVIDPNTGATMSNIPGENISVYEGAPHWLKGYRQIDTPKQLPGSSNVNSVVNTAKNLEDLKAAQQFAQQYGYELPTNIERIAQSNQLTDRTIRGMMDRHNTFVRGVSTNWDELGKRNPEILRHLEGKGFDLSTKEGTQAAAEYMATHIPINTGYGRASLNNEVFDRGMEGLYTSNSIPTAEGYTYGQGYITKVKRPTNYSSSNRQDWISQNNPQYYEHNLPGGNTFMIDGKIHHPIKMDLPYLYNVKDYDNINVFKNKIIKDLEKNASDLKTQFERTATSNPEYSRNMRISYDRVIKQIEDIKAQKWETADVKFDKNLLKTEHQSQSFGTDFGGFGNTAEDVTTKLSSSVQDEVKHSKNLMKLTKQVGAKNNKKIAELTEEVADLMAKGDVNKLPYNEKLRLQSLEKEILDLRWDSKHEVKRLHTEYLDNNFPGWQNQKDKYAHYIHLGTPGEKVLQPIKSWEITPEIWKNKSRSHTNKYSKKFTAMSIGGMIAPPPAAIGAGTYGVNQKQDAQPTMQKFGGNLNFQFGGYIPSWLNPMNWGVTDYTGKKDFNSAYAAARQAGEKEFMWNGKRFNTDYKGTPQQQLKETGLTNEQIQDRSKLNKNLTKNIYPYSYDNLEKRIWAAGVLGKKEENREAIDKDPRPYDKEKLDALNLYAGVPQKNNTFRISNYKPSTSKDNINYYTFNKQDDRFVKNLIDYAYLKSKGAIDGSAKDYDIDVKGLVPDQEKNVMGNYKMSTGKDDRGTYVSFYDKWDLAPMDFGKPFEIYDRIYTKDYSDGKQKRMYYTDKELLELDINKKNFDTLALQRELANRGYTLPESTKQDGTFDGVFGDETKNALLDYQAKHVKNRKQFGGNFSSSYEYDPEMMFIDKYNTPLTPAEERKFKMWAAEESKRQGRNILMDMGAYDLKGFWKSGDYKRMDQDNHGSDTWKKPNHPTFSNESIYHGVDGWYGGNWTKNAGYQPSKQMLELYTPNYYKRMFGTEPHRPEYLDMSRYESGINAPTPMYYKQGGQHGGTLPKAQSAGQTSSTPFRFYDYQTSPTYSGGTLPEIMVSSDNVPYPYYNRLTPEEKKFFNQDNPIGRSVRSIANTGKRGQTYNDLSRVAKDIESFGAEMTGIPGTIRFSKSPLEKLAGAGRTIEATILGSSPFITSPYNQEDVADFFDTMDAFGVVTTAAAPLKTPLQQGVKQVFKSTTTPLKIVSKLDDAVSPVVGTPNFSNTARNAYNRLYNAAQGTDEVLNEVIGELLRGKVNRKSIEKGNKWLSDWINHPTTQAKIDNSIDTRLKYLGFYSNPAEQEKLLELIRTQAKNFKPNTKEYSLLKQLDDNLQQYLSKTSKKPIHMDNWGVSYEHQYSPLEKLNIEKGLQKPEDRFGSWISRTLGMPQKKRISTTVHEGTHDWVTDDILRETELRNIALKNMTPEALDDYIEWASLRNNGEDPVKIMGKKRAMQGYLADPTEQHARIMELRQQLGMTPDDVMDIEGAEKVIKFVDSGKSVVKPLFLNVMGRDPAKLAELFNKFWMAPPITVGAGSLGNQGLQQSQTPEQKYGGVLPKAQAGAFGTITTPVPFTSQKENAVIPKRFALPRIQPKVNPVVPEMITIKDGRKIRLTTGQAVNPNTDLVGKSYPTKTLRSILDTAKNKGLSKDDALTLAAMDLQETRWGETDESIGHVLHGNDFAKSPVENFINAYLKSKETADRLKLSDEYTRLQVYNGLGTVTPDTEKDYHGFRMKKIYGVPVPASGINMRKNPLYGKQIVDIRDNVLKQNPEFLKLVDEYYKMGGVTNEMLDVYKNYINGVYTNTEKEKDAIKIYDKLNRKYYREAKNANKSVPNYIMSLIK